MLIKFCSLNFVRKSWILVFDMRYMNWGGGRGAVGDVGGLHTANWGGR